MPQSSSASHRTRARRDALTMRSRHCWHGAAHALRMSCSAVSIPGEGQCLCQACHCTGVAAERCPVRRRAWSCAYCMLRRTGRPGTDAGALRLGAAASPLGSRCASFGNPSRRSRALPRKSHREHPSTRRGHASHCLSTGHALRDRCGQRSPDSSAPTRCASGQ